MTKESIRTYGLFKGISFIVFILNFVFISTCRKKNHSQYHWSTLTWPGVHIRIWMCCKRNVSTTIEMLMVIEPCLTRGQDSRNFRCWVRNLLNGTCGPGGDSQTFKQLLDLILCWPKFGQECQRAQRKSRKRNGLLRSPSSTMLENCEISTSPIWKTKSKRDHQKRKKEIWNSIGSCHALQDGETLKEATGNCSWWWHSPTQENQVCLCCGSSRFHTGALWVYPSEKSWRSHRGERVQFFHSLQFGA